MLGLKRILWLPIVASFSIHLVKWIDSNTILLHTIDPRYKDEDCQNYAICQEAKTILESFRIKIVELQLAWDMVQS